jgi:HEAT repeat protein
MRAALTIALAAVASAALADGAPGRPRVDGAVLDVLSVADEVVARERLDQALGPAPVATLRATATDGGVDPGIRLRALRALGLYPSPESRAALHDALVARGRCDGDGAAVTGTDLVFVRAALEALGAIGDPEDVAWIVPCLQAKSRDLRVAAARSLRDLGASTAVCPLQRQRDVEVVPQVQSAISAALRRWPAQICPRSASTRSRTAE